MNLLMQTQTPVKLTVEIPHIDLHASGSEQTS